MLKRLLCPVDFSSHARSALRYASELASRTGARLFVLHVSDPLLDAAAAAAAYDMRVLRQRTLEELQRFVARAAVESQPQLVTASGHSAPTILREAQRLRVDAMVMGSRGLTGPTKLFFGSTTERTLHDATVPVLVVPRLPQRQRDWRAALAGWPGGTALVPVDLADYRVDDVRQAVRFVEVLGAQPQFLYVVPPVRVPTWLRLQRVRPDPARLDAAWARFLKSVGGAARAADCQVARGDPAETIARVASAGAGLVVLTLKRGRSLLGPRRGSVSYQLVAKDVVPVLAIPGGN